MGKLADVIEPSDRDIAKQTESDHIRKAFADFVAGKSTGGNVLADAAEYFTMHTDDHTDVHTDHSPPPQSPPGPK
jgi:hypothetical protein